MRSDIEIEATRKPVSTFNIILNAAVINIFDAHRERYGGARLFLDYR